MLTVGIIDKGYRGNIIAKLDVVSVFDIENRIEKGYRLTQICTPDLEPISEIKIVNSLPSSKRENKGFGSSNKKINLF